MKEITGEGMQQIEERIRVELPESCDGVLIANYCCIWIKLIELGRASYLLIDEPINNKCLTEPLQNTT